MSSIETPSYSPVNPREAEDLQKECGRPIKERQVMEILLRRRRWKAIEALLEETKN